MKKIYLVLGLISYQSYSQDFAGNSTTHTEIKITAGKKEIVDVPSTVFLKRNGEYVKVYLNNMPSAIVADFAKRYDIIDGVTWKIDENDVNGYFTSEGEKIVVTYRKNGHLISTRKTSDGSNIPKNIKSFIQSELNKGYTISMLTEVAGEKVTLYEVSMVNDKNISIVRLSKNKDGEPEVTDRISYVKVGEGAL